MDKQKKTITRDKAIRTFKTVICPSICSLGKLENTNACIKKVDKCISEGACAIYRNFVNALDK